MSIKASRFYGIGFATLAVAAFAACSSDSNPGTPSAAGAPGTAGAPGSAGSVGTAGAVSTAGTGAGTAGAGGTTACAGVKPTGTLITSFADTVAATDTGNPGGLTFMAGIPGGTFTYPRPPVFTLSATGAALEVKGTVSGYDGFGLYFNSCTDASAYTGVSFNIKGNVGASGTVSFRFHNIADQIVANNGICVVPAGSTDYDACHFATFPVTVTPGGSVVSVKFSDVTGGFPVPTVDGKDLVGLEWAFTWTPPAAGTAGAGGAGTAGAGGAVGTAGAGGTGTAGAGGTGTAGAGGTSTAGAGGTGTAGAGGTGTAGAGGTAATAGTGGAGGAGTAGAGGAGGSTVAGSYPVDVTIDDVMFIGGPAAGGTGGAGGTAGAGGTTAGAGGASAGAGGTTAGAGGASAGAGGTTAGAGGATAGAGGKGGAGGSAGKGGGQ